MRTTTRYAGTTRGRLIASLLLTAGLLAVPTAAASAQTTTPDQADAARAAVATDENERALHYWTPERMKDSRPAAPGLTGEAGPPAVASDRGRPVGLPPGKPDASRGTPAAETAPATSSSSTTTTTATSTSSTTEGYWQGSNTANPNAQIGRLFYQQWDAVSATWKNYNCSGSVVNSENRSVVWTAGHCVYQTYSNVWNRNYVFCPGYRAGSCAFGKWTPYSQHTTTQWQNAVCSPTTRCTNAEFQYDLGALKMNAINGTKIGNWVGYHGISFNGATYQSRYAFGYPLNKHSGEYLYYCAGTNSVSGVNLRLAPCTAGGGASGGPWLSQISSSWLGVVHSVNSHGDDTFMNGPYQGNVALNLFSSVRY
jgi:V8-like Glu-specific endopeptidase